MEIVARVVFRGADRVFLGLSTFAVVGAFLLGGVLLADGLNATGTGRAIGITLGAAMFALGAVRLTHGLLWARGLVIRDDQLSISRGFRTWRLKVADVAGVGLVFQRTPGNTRDLPGWYLNVWTRDGSQYRARQFCLLALSRRTVDASQRAQLRSFTAPWPAEIPLPCERAPELAQSRPGRTAARVDDAVRDAQGEHGLLATAQLQKFVRFLPTASRQSLAWWSPDGEMGRTT